MRVVLERELLVASRNRATYWSRVWVGLFALAFAIWIFLWFSATTRGFLLRGGLFRIVASVVFLLCVFSGSGRTADSLASEKRNGTLGLLLLTQLTPFGIVFGKLVSHSLRLVFGLIAVIPLLLTPILIGGVEVAEVARAAFVCLFTLFFSAAMGLRASAYHLEQIKANHAATRDILLLCIALPILSWGLQKLGTSASWSQGLMLFSPTNMIYLASSSAYRILPEDFWISVILTLVYGMLALRASVRRLGRGMEWDPKSRSGPLKGVKTPDRSILDQNAFRWLALRRSESFWGDWTVFGLVAVLLLILGGRKLGWDAFLLLLATVVLIGSASLTLIFKVRVAGAASYRLATDRESGCLELLLNTRLTLGEIVRGQWLALRDQFRSYAGLLTLGYSLCFVGLVFSVKHYADLARFGGEQGAEYWVPEVVGAYAASVVLLLLDVAALGWVGMWAAARFSSLANANIFTVGAILALPYALFIFALSVADFFHIRPPSALRPEIAWFLLFFGISVANSVVWVTWCPQRLFKKMRAYVAARVPQPSV